MEKALSKREGIDGMVFISGRVGVSYFDVERTFPFLYLDLASKQMFPGKEKV